MTQTQYADAYSLGFDRTIRFLLSRGALADPAEEAAQGAWAKGWECREQLRDPVRLRTWVNTIALNLFRDACRRPRTSELPAEIPIPAQTGPKTVDLQRLMEKCKPAERAMLEKHYLAGYTTKELAAQGGYGASTIRVRLFRLRRRLRKIARAKRTRDFRGLAVPSSVGHDESLTPRGS